MQAAPPEDDEQTNNLHVDTLMNTLSGQGTFYELREGNTLDDIVGIIAAQITGHDNPEEVGGYSRTADFVQQFTLFASAGEQNGKVRTPDHIANLVCDLAEIGPNSRVLDITCGSGTFLAAARNAMLSTATPEQEEEIPNRIFGIDEDLTMWGIARNQMTSLGVPSNNIVHGSCFDEDIVARVEHFSPNIVMFNPPHTITAGTQPRRPFEFLNHACNLCEDGGLVFALLSVPLLVHKKAGSGAGHIVPDRRTLLENHTLIATMQLPDHIFQVMPSADDVQGSMQPALVVMRANRPHDLEQDRVWMAMWKQDGKMFQRTKGLVENQHYERKQQGWDNIRSRWVQSYRYMDEIPLERIPWPGKEPPFGASHLRKIQIEGDDWIAASKIPSPSNENDSSFFENIETIWADYILHMRTMRKG